MRSAMANSLVGDDVFDEDPTVKKLEDMTASLLGKEAGLFVSSGTMGNLIGLGVHCKRGEEIIVGNRNHIFVYEGGGASALLGIIFHTIPTLNDGTLNPQDILNAIRPEDPHYPRTKLVTVENTQNKSNGQPLPVLYMDQISQLCKEKNLIFHVDGARLMNASISLKEDASRVVEGVDSISLCLSKGLGAPVGSVLVGEKDFIYEAKRLRKVLGGGMRQAGVIASAGIHALENNIERLQIDHDNAKLLANALSEFPGIVIQKDQIKTNILYFDMKDPRFPQPSDIVEETKYTEHNQQLATQFVRDLATEYNIHIGAPSQGKMRAVTSLEVNENDIIFTINAMKELLPKYFDGNNKNVSLEGLKQDPKLIPRKTTEASVPLFQNS